MKKILFKKILIDCLLFFLITLSSASVIIWVFQAVNFLDIMIEDGRDYMVYINYTLLTLPKIVSKILPFALFFSFMHTIAKYETSNELMIFWNFGVNKIKLINYFFFFSILITIIQILLTSLVVPKSQDTARSFIRTSDINFFDSFVKPKKFNDTIKDLTIFSEDKDSSNNLKNIYLKKKQENGNFQITYSKKGVFREINGSQILVLYDGETINRVNEKITNFSFSKSDFNLANLETNTTTYVKTQEISTKKLIECHSKLKELNSKNNPNLKIENCSYENLINIFKELYKRLIIPLYIPILILTSCLLIIYSKENINYLKYRISIFLLGLFVIIFSETTIRFIENNFFDNLKLIIIPLLLLFALYSIFIFKFKFKLT